MDDDAIRALVTRLARPHSSGGDVVERAAIFAEGADSSDVLRWIDAHAGEPEAAAPLTSGRGLHSARTDGAARANTRAPLRYVFPPGSLS
jgi:hypothetical protein